MSLHSLPKRGATTTMLYNQQSPPFPPFLCAQRLNFDTPALSYSQKEIELKDWKFCFIGTVDRSLEYAINELYKKKIRKKENKYILLERLKIKKNYGDGIINRRFLY